MSDSDGDMGGLGSKAMRKETKSSQRLGSSSSKPTSKANTRTKGKNIVETEEESSSVEEIVPEEQPKNQRGRRATVASTQTNGLQNAKEKGKGRAVPEKVPNRKAADIDVLDTDADAVDADAVAESLMNAINTSNTRPIRNDRETTHLRRQLEEAQDRISKLSKQLEELFKTRQTEPEKLLTELKDRYEAQLEAKTKTISNLSNSLAAQAPLFANSSKLSAVELLTREKADEEKRLLQNNMNQLKQEISAKDEVIKEKTQLEKELRFEINDLKSRPPPSNARSRGILGPDEPKNVELIKFYEDLTNVIVPNIRQVKSSHLDLDEWALTCIYTYDNVELGINQSLNFSLRLLYTAPHGETEPITSKDQLTRSVRYVPMELDKEPADLVERLGYLATTFTFDHDQLPLFLSSMNTGLAKALVTHEDEDGQKSENEPIMVED